MNENVKQNQTLVELFPDFINWHKWKTVTLSSDDKLVLTNIDKHEEFSVGIEYDKISRQYSLTSEINDKTIGQRFIGESISIGTMSDIIQKKIDWGDYNDIQLRNAIITQTIFKYSSYEKVDASNVRFDGFYYGAVNDRSKEILRFYNGKQIVSFRTRKNIEQVDDWFDIHTGSYTVKNNIIIGIMDNGFTDRFTISFVTKEGKLFTKLYGQYDVPLIFFQFKDHFRPDMTSNIMNNAIKIILSILFLLCLFDMPYGFYQFVRFAGLIGFAFFAYEANKRNKQMEIVIYGALALLFQPFFKIALGRQIWNIVDVIVVLGLILSIWIKPKKQT